MTNFKNAADAKQAINEKLYDEMKKSQQEYYDFVNEKNDAAKYALSHDYGRELLYIRDDSGEWREATQDEFDIYKKIREERTNQALQAQKDYTDFQNISNFNDIYCRS